MREFRLIPEPKQVKYGQGTIRTAGVELVVEGEADVLARLNVAIGELQSLWKRTSDIALEGHATAGRVVPSIRLLLGLRNSGNNPEPERYTLSIAEDAVRVEAAEPAGLFNGLQTFGQMVKQSSGAGELPFVEVEDYPDLKLRGILVDLRFQSFHMDYLIQFVKQISQYKVNMICIEYSNKFPYENQYDVIRDMNSFSQAEVDQLVQTCHDHFVEMIPLVQSFGHMEYLLHHDNFKYLREDPGFASQCCPMHEDSLKCSTDLLIQIKETHKHATKLFIGGDETFHLGKCPKCSEFAAAHGKGGLYVHYANKLAEVVLGLGLEPITCSDMLLAYPEVIDDLHPQYGIADWDYWTVEADPPFMKDWKTKTQIPLDKLEELPEETKSLFKQYLMKEDGTYRAFGYTKLFIDRGFKTYALPSTAAVGPDCYWVPQYATHTPNIVEYSLHGKQYGIEGTINTAWELFLFETTLYGVVLGGEYGWGQPSGGLEQFNRNFAQLYFGSEDFTEAVEAFYKLTEPYAIVEKKFPKIYTNRAYGRDASITMEDVASNAELEQHIDLALHVFNRLKLQVPHNSYTLEQWELGAKIKRFWLGVLKAYAKLKAEASASPESAADRVEEVIARFESDLRVLKAEVSQVLISTVPIEKVVQKNENSFRLFEELKDELRAGKFR